MIAEAAAQPRRHSGARSFARPTVALLTGGADKPYTVGLSLALSAHGVTVDVVGSDDVSSEALLNDPRINFLNLRDQKPEKSALRKVTRIIVHYARLLHYASTSRARIFHILWSNKIEWLDRTLLLLYYRLLGKRLAFTAHNVNAGKRDGNDSLFNRVTLRIQYHLVDRIFVHTERMKGELVEDFAVAPERVTVIPFGINSSVPNTRLTSVEARRQLGLGREEKVLLFFGNIAPYKGLEFLVTAFEAICRESGGYRLLIAGRKKGADTYWQTIEAHLTRLGDRVIQRIEYIPDEETEVYFKAADVLLLPYTHIFQSGVLFLGYNFGLPAIAADVGSLRDEIIAGETGYVFRARDAADLAQRIREYFESEMYRYLDQYRERIRAYASERYSWRKVAAASAGVYAELGNVSVP